MTKSACFYLLRHAESDNNARGKDDGRAVAEGSVEAAAEGSVAPTKKAARIPDPALSVTGVKQAKHTGKFFKNVWQDETLKKACVKDVNEQKCKFKPGRLVISPMTRTLQTIQPTVSELNKLTQKNNLNTIPIEINLQLYEEGGIFDGERPKNGRYANGKSEDDYKILGGLNREQMLEILPGLEFPQEIPDSGWWRGGIETDPEVAQRADSVKEWMWEYVQNLEPETEVNATVLVSHGLFYGRLLNALLDLAPMDETKYLLTANCAYWLLQLDILAPSDKYPDGQRNIVFMACNEVSHVPMCDRTGHSFQGYKYCPVSYPNDDCVSDEEDLVENK